ncbi:MAG: NADH-quinone oxidoreductase subunit L [Deltaproteobacteria bacterium]|nr:NADH-quinone oxidoreductase subunit L [Deltaproteobacteria bacterium]
MLETILFAPLLGFLINGLIQRYRLTKLPIAIIGCGSVLISFVSAFYIFLQFLEDPPSWRLLTTTLFEWIPTLGVDVSLKMDALSILLTLVVTGVGFLIHLYSVHYMEKDSGFGRYFAYLNLFTFSMLLLVLANNLLLLFIGWEGVGLCSYLLIGFWYEDPLKAQAGKKAFLVNRIGDFAFLLGLFLTFQTFGTLNIESLSQWTFGPDHANVITWITLLFFIGACGKSAQIPLYVWLPDAMAGPTPVSALIHAATMVTAGVYMIARLHFLYLQSPLTLSIVAGIGLLTALFSASMAFFQNDIKKVLAYSTISQLGFMFLAMGVGAFVSGIFHLITHAFFKALLFLAAGSVIHALHEEQNIQNMGGLHQRLPLTHVVFLFGTLAILGFPPFSGFFSKDEILWYAFQHHFMVWFLGWLASLMTTYYMVRLFTLVFYRKSSHEGEQHLHEAPPLMALSLIVLALLSAIGGWIGVPHIFHIDHFLNHFLGPVFQTLPESHGTPATEWGLMAWTTLTSLGVAIWTFLSFHTDKAWLTHFKLKFSKLHRLIEQKYYVDEFYHFMLVAPIRNLCIFAWKKIDTLFIDGFFNGLASWATALGLKLSLLQNGNTQTYAIIFMIGVIGILMSLWI